MSKRLDSKLWQDVADYLAKFQTVNGIFTCAYQTCQQPLPQPLRNRVVPRREWTTINHIDGNKDDWRVENLNLMHQHCNNSYFSDMNRRARLNLLLSKQAQSRLDGGSKQANVSRESISQPPILAKFRIVPSESDSFSNRKNHECMPLYFKLIFARVLNGSKRGEYYGYDTLNDAVAMEVGEVPNTTGRYLNMLISLSGPFEQMPHPQTNKEVIAFRNQEYAFLTVDELMEMFPPEGKRTVDPAREKRLLEIATERIQQPKPIEQKTPE